MLPTKSVIKLDAITDKKATKYQVRQITSVSKRDQVAIKQLIGDQFNMSFTGNTAIFTKKVNLNDMRVSGAKRDGDLANVAVRCLLFFLNNKLLFNCSQIAGVVYSFHLNTIAAYPV